VTIASLRARASIRARAALALLAAGILAGCAGGAVGVGGGGYYEEGAPYDYDLGFYDEPWGSYGYWGPGYYVGPPRWGGRWHGGGWHGQSGARPPYRPPASGRSMPSIPRSPRGGGMHRR